MEIESISIWERGDVSREADCSADIEGNRRLKRLHQSSVPFGNMFSSSR